MLGILLTRENIFSLVYFKLLNVMLARAGDYLKYFKTYNQYSFIYSPDVMSKLQLVIVTPNCLALCRAMELRRARVDMPCPTDLTTWAARGWVG